MVIALIYAFENKQMRCDTIFRYSCPADIRCITVRNFERMVLRQYRLKRTGILYV